MVIRVQRTILKTQHCLWHHSTLKTQKCKVFAIERFYDKQGNETEMVVMKAGRDTSGIIMNKWLSK